MPVLQTQTATFGKPSTTLSNHRNDAVYTKTETEIAYIIRGKAPAKPGNDLPAVSDVFQAVRNVSGVAVVLPTGRPSDC